MVAACYPSVCHNRLMSVLCMGQTARTTPGRRCTNGDQSIIRRAVAALAQFQRICGTYTCATGAAASVIFVFASLRDCCNAFDALNGFESE
jgi:hypothetical protein